jgi:hypothetical protein
MSPIQSVLSVYKENSIDFNCELEYHLLNGIVLSDDKTFMFAIPCDSENPEITVPIDNANCIFISMLAGDIKHAMEVFQDRFDFIAFKRQFKNSNHTRFYSYSQFHKKLK